jgi:hypothetical protein
LKTVIFSSLSIFIYSGEEIELISIEPKTLIVVKLVLFDAVILSFLKSVLIILALE